jgi:hypothetical protein
MINLLSRTEQQKIYREYLLRITTILGVFMGITGLVFIIILIPTYMRFDSEIKKVQSELEAKKSQITSEDQAQVAEAKEFLSELQVLRGTVASTSVVSLVERIVSLKPSRVSIVGFSYEAGEKAGAKLTIRGKADRREDLLEFKERLETSAGYTNIDLPAQTLIKRTDIQFTMDLLSSQAPEPARSPQPTTEENDLIPLP